MPDLNESDRYLRQQGIFDPANHPNAAVTFVGVGGIGSFAAFGAAKLGIPHITLVDPDVVEEHNQPNQFHSINDVGRYKTDALGDYIVEEAGETNQTVTEIPAALEEMDRPSGVVVSGLDSMEARTHLWEQHVKLNYNVPLLIDARLGGQIIVIYTVNPMDVDQSDAYEATLHSDEEGVDLPCTERGVIDVGLQVGSLITRMLRGHFSDETIPEVTFANQSTYNLTTGSY